MFRKYQYMEFVKICARGVLHVVGAKESCLATL